MTQVLTHPTAIPATPFYRRRWPYYLFFGLLANAALWSASLFYLKVTEPTYTSEWSVTLPGTGSETNINLPNIGNATAQDRTPYDSPNRDPRENYKFIASSAPVIRAAAEQVGLTPGEFGSPRIEIIDNTSLMRFTVNGDSPEEAQAKAIALHDAFEQRLTSLRTDEKNRRNSGVEDTLQQARGELEAAQARLSDFKARSGLTSVAQVERLSSNIEDLRSQRALLMAERQQVAAQLQQLSSNLNISAPQVAEAFTLSADQRFQQNLTDYSQATATLESLEQQFGPNHPVVVRERTRQEASRTAMFSRAQSLLGRPVTEANLAQLSVQGNDSARENLFSQVITTQVTQQGFNARTTELDQQMVQLEGRLRDMAQALSTLETLNRDVTIAEALFSSALTRLNLRAADTSGSYPSTQMLTEPSLPSEASSPRTQFVLMGTAMGSLLITMGLITLSLRGDRRWLLVSPTEQPTGQMAGDAGSQPAMQPAPETAAMLHAGAQPEVRNGKVPADVRLAEHGAETK